MKNLLINLIVLIAGISFFADAQPLRRFNSSSYNVNDGLMQSHVWDMGFDAAGFMWLSYETGLQRYDGQHFIDVPGQKDLPENKYITFLKSKNELLWMAHSKGISVYNGVTGKFRFAYDYSSGNPFPGIRPIGEDDSIVYFYSTNGFIIGINENSLQVVKKSKFPFSTSSSDIYGLGFFHVSRAIINHKVIICFKSETLIQWDLQKGATIEINHFTAGDFISADGFVQIEENKCLYVTESKMKVYDFQKDKYITYANNLNSRGGSDVNYFEPVNDNFILMSKDNDLFFCNKKTMKLEQHIVNFQNQSFSHFAISAIRMDDFGNIYLVTRSEGFVKLLASSFPISYYGSLQKESNFITSIEVDKENNRVLAGTLNSGFLVFDTLQNLQKHILQIGTMQTSGLLTISGITHIKNNDYLLFPRINPYAVLWNASSGKMKKIPLFFKTKSGQFVSNIRKGFGYYFTKLILNNSKELIAIDGCLYELDFSNMSMIRAFLHPYPLIKGLCLYKNNILLGTGEDIEFLAINDYKYVKTVHIPDCGEIRCLVSHNNFIYVGSNRGLFILNENGKVVSAFSKLNGLPNDYIYALAIDNRENIWCSTNKGIIRIDKDNGIFALRKEDGLQENEFNTNVVHEEHDGELFFGGVNGINSFYPSQITGVNDSPVTALTNIKVNDVEIFKDSAIWNLQKIKLPYTSDNLYFEFTAMGKQNADQYLYQYRMLSIDKNWVRSGDIRSTRYVLQPGHYVFQLYAGKVYDANPKKFKAFDITIKPPFWQTWWFRMIAVMTVAGFMLIPFWRHNRRIYNKKLRELQLQHELQRERERISRDLHDNLGAYAAAIAVNVSKVKKDSLASKMIEELQSNSQAIVTQLNDTIWALNREAISLTAISDRFKVFLQKIQSSYQQINFSVNEKTIATDVLLSPANALHLFRIMQEAVSNAARHSNCRFITISLESNSICLISITDDGDGIKNETIKNTGNGLKNIKLRASETGWDVKWENQKPHGTKFIITLKGEGVL